jgi:hypothetical protein
MRCGGCAPRCWGRRRRLPELLAEAGSRLAMSRVGVAMDVIWDLVVFLALVAVGLLVLNLLARRR